MARGSVLLVAANGRRVERVALAGERVLVEHDGRRVALVTVDGERLWDGHPQSFMSDSAFVVNPAGRRAVVYGGERLQVLDLAAGRVIAEADSMSARPLRPDRRAVGPGGRRLLGRTRDLARHRWRA